MWLPCLCRSWIVYVRELKLERLGLLRGVRMLATCEHVELAEHRAAQRVLGKHALHGELQCALGMLLQQFAQGMDFRLPDVTGVVVIELVISLLPVTWIFSAFSTTRLSPMSTCGL